MLDCIVITFLALVGERLAAETTRNLMETIRDYVEALFQSEEQHKRSTKKTDA